MLAGRSVSAAVAVKVRVLPSLTVWGPMAASTGARFTSPTVTVMVSLAVSAPSLTTTSKL